MQNAKKVDAVALQYVGAAEISTKKKKKLQLPAMSPWVDRTDQYVEEIEKNLKNDYQKASEEYKNLKEEYNAVTNSLSWKLTRPLRYIKALIK